MSTHLTHQPIQTHTLSAERDPMGAAILDYQKEQRAGRLRVRSSMFEDDEMPVAHLFRSQNEMPLLEQKGATGPFRYGWSFDYPAAESYLTPLFSPSSFPPLGSNYSFYSNPQVDQLISQGDQAASEDEAIADYQQAEDLIAEDMPMAPLFFTKIQTVHTDRVDNVRIDLFQRPVWSEVTVTG